jgi:hypothetical protein
MAKKTTDSFIAPFPRMFVLLLQRGQCFTGVAFKTILAALHCEMFGRCGRHRLSFIFRGKEIERADYGEDDEDENQITRLHSGLPFHFPFIIFPLSFVIEATLFDH